MTVVGFNFTKIVAEKSEAATGKISISNNVSIKDVDEMKLNFGKSNQKGIKFTFEFTSKYNPNIGSITIMGEVISTEDDKKVKEITSGWKKDKKIPKEVMAAILNTVLNKCNIQALILSRDINLPSPVPLPKVEIEEKK